MAGYDTEYKELVDVILPQDIDQHDANVPKAFCCPISRLLMVEPVILIADYQTLKLAIISLFRLFCLSPF